MNDSQGDVVKSKRIGNITYRTVYEEVILVGKRRVNANAN
jgi:hypothetical protein